jgi:hypothetical protein
MAKIQRREEEEGVRNVLYGSVSDFICRTKEIDEESSREIRFRERKGKIYNHWPPTREADNYPAKFTAPKEQ